MRRPDVFTLDYSHPLAQGLVFAQCGFSGLDRSLVKNNPSVFPEHAYFDNTIGRYALDGSKGGALSFAAHDAYNFTGKNGFTCSFLAAFFDGASTDQTDIFGAGYTSGWSVRAVRNNGVPYNYRAIRYYSPITGNVNQNISTYREFGKFTGYSVVVEYGVGVRLYVNGVLDTVLEDTTCTPAFYTGAYTYAGSTANVMPRVADGFIHDRILSLPEIKILSNIADPMLGGLIVEERPVLYFDMGGSGITYNLIQDAKLSISSAFSLIQDSTTKVSSEISDINDSSCKLSFSLNKSQDTLFKINSDFSKLQDFSSKVSLNVYLKSDAYFSISHSFVNSIKADFLSKISKNFDIFQNAKSPISVSFSISQDSVSSVAVVGNYRINMDSVAKISSDVSMAFDNRSKISLDFSKIFDGEGKISSDHNANQSALVRVSSHIIINEDIISKISKEFQEVLDAISSISSEYNIMQDGKSHIILVDFAQMPKVELESFGLTMVIKESSSFIVKSLESTSKITIVKI